MFRILKILLLLLSAYAIFTATPTQHQDMMKGALAFKDAFLQACIREGGLCTLAIEKIQSSLFSRSSTANSANSTTLENNFSSGFHSETSATNQRP